ncbi:hypothetical protein [Streptomyces sp. CMB-StM0423]|uniref:hypothetical protein n=1 Tax=Streptomyces sp. CMB-StM0423 TaxID=2059884 RepID=UPI000C702E7A|nr:hypothetical protein [Streptomyces sp. CMB-StM0423]AUH41364.1 hypothetical protein CXR04_14925 [Streptomyces sp. CMB-StM0423]
MSSASIAPPRGADSRRATDAPQPDSPHIATVAVRATRHHLHTAWRAVTAFGGAVVSVVVLGEYADR